MDVLGNKREGADVVFFAPVLMMRGIHDMVFDASDGKVNREIKYAKWLCNKFRRAASYQSRVAVTFPQ